MAFIPRARSPAVVLNLTPMIDVTFLLLIFFVCANTWSHAELAEKLALPSPIESAREEASEERPRLTINLRANGDLIVGSNATTRERLAELLKLETRKHGERLDVLVRAHKETPYEHTQGVFQACTAAGVKSVRFAVLKMKE